jgi:hypothetical protein
LAEAAEALQLAYGTFGLNPDGRALYARVKDSIAAYRASLDSLGAGKGEAGTPQEILYTNHRRETARRKIIPSRVWFGSTEWHLADQWFVDALDVEKGAVRSFALKDFGEPTNIARQEWREIYGILQAAKEPVAERSDEHPLGMGNVIRRILAERDALRAIERRADKAERERDGALKIIADRETPWVAAARKATAELSAERTAHAATRTRSLEHAARVDELTAEVASLRTARDDPWRFGVAWAGNNPRVPYCAFIARHLAEAEADRQKDPRQWVVLDLATEPENDKATLDWYDPTAPTSKSRLLKAEREVTEALRQCAVLADRVSALERKADRHE